MMMLVDFENVQKLDLGAVPGHAAVRIFVGASQAKVPMGLVLQAQALGARLETRKLATQPATAAQAGEADLLVLPAAALGALPADRPHAPLLLVGAA